MLFSSYLKMEKDSSMILFVLIHLMLFVLVHQMNIANMLNDYDEFKGKFEFPMALKGKNQ